MKNVIAAAILSLTATAAFAQPATAPAQKDPATPAVATPSTDVAAKPAAGANSFTEDQAKSRFAEAGFTNVSELAKDKDGVWRGKGMKGGKSHEIALDYQGNIFPK